MAESYAGIYNLLQQQPVAPFDPIEAMRGVTDLQAARQRGLAGQLALQAAQEERQRQAQIREAYRRAYSGTGTASPAGPLTEAGAVAETVRGGSPTAAFPGGGGASPFPPLAEQEAASTQLALTGNLPQGYNPETGYGPAPLTSPQVLQRTPGQPPMARAGLSGMAAGVEQAQLVRDLYQIDPQAGMAAEKHATESQMSQFKMLEKQNSFVSQVTRAVLQADTQEAYEAGIAKLNEFGIPTQHLPAIYDRRMVEHYNAMATDAETRLKEQQLALEAKQESRLGEQLRLEQTREQRQARQFETTEERQQRQAEETERHHRAQEEQAGAAAGVAQTKEQAARENELRDEFNTLTKDYRTQADAYGRVQVSAQDPSAAGDLSMIFSYMKLLDPGSVVREGEQATAANARGVDEAVRSWYNRVLSGEKLAPEQRKDFVDRAQRLYTQATQDYSKTRTQYQSLARRNRVDPANVTLEYGSTATPAPQAPAAPAAPTGPKTMSEADIAEAIRQTKRSRAEVLEAARKKRDAAGNPVYNVPEK